MKTGYVLIGVMLMFLSTYLPRTLPLLLCSKRIENPFWLAFFKYVPYAVLTVLTVPSIFTSTRTPFGAVVGFGIAVYLSLKNKPMLTVALSGAAAVWLIEGLIMPFIV